MGRSRNGTLTLVNMWQGGERDAFEELLERKLLFLANHARVKMTEFLRHREETEDVVQVAAARLFRYMPPRPFRDRGAVHLLLKRVVENTICDRVTFYQREKRGAGKEESLAGRPVVAHDPSVSSVVSNQERVNQMRMALDLLPIVQRQAVILAEYSGKTYKQIEEILGVATGQAGRLHRKGLLRMAELVRAMDQGRLDECFRRNYRSGGPSSNGLSVPLTTSSERSRRTQRAGTRSR